MKIKILNGIFDCTTEVINPFEEDSDCYVLKFFFKKGGNYFEKYNKFHCYFDLWDYDNCNLGNDITVKFKI